VSKGGDTGVKLTGEKKRETKLTGKKPEKRVGPNKERDSGPDLEDEDYISEDGLDAF